MHNEIIDFYFYIRPSEENKKKRKIAVERIVSFIKEYVHVCEVKEFGSYATGLYLPNADVDLVVLSDTYSDKVMINELKKGLKKNRDYFTNINIIQNASVPLIKFLDT